jgi:hypothetical protein
MPEPRLYLFIPGRLYNLSGIHLIIRQRESRESGSGILQSGNTKSKKWGWSFSSPSISRFKKNHCHPLKSLAAGYCNREIL